MIVEIQGAEGGEEANLWAGDLYRMYQHYAERRGLKTEVLSSQPSDHGGFRDVTFLVKGADAWSRLKYEGGPHRVQRVPETESQGRIHTSAATVAVLPEAEEVDVEIDPNDLEIDVYRSTGPGGQSVNTTDSAVRITHMPTGSRRLVPGREEPAPEQGQGDADPARPAAPGRAGPPARRGERGAARAGEGRRPLREDPHVQLQGEPASPTTASGSRCTRSTGCSPVSSTRSSTRSRPTNASGSSAASDMSADRPLRGARRGPRSAQRLVGRGHRDRRGRGAVPGRGGLGLRRGGVADDRRQQPPSAGARPGCGRWSSAASAASRCSTCSARGRSAGSTSWSTGGC